MSKQYKRTLEKDIQRKKSKKATSIIDIIIGSLVVIVVVLIIGIYLAEQESESYLGRPGLLPDLDEMDVEEGLTIPEGDPALRGWICEIAGDSSFFLQTFNPEDRSMGDIEKILTDDATIYFLMNMRDQSVTMASSIDLETNVIVNVWGSVQPDGTWFASYVGISEKQR